MTDNILVGAGAYDASYNNPASYVYISYETDRFLDDRFTVGVDAGFIHGYEEYLPDEVLLTGGVVPMIAPFVSVKIADADSILPDGTNIKFNAVPLPRGEDVEGVDPVDAIITAQLRVPF